MSPAASFSSLQPRSWRTAACRLCACSRRPGWTRTICNESKRGKTLVVVFLRGGMDGLNFVVPFKDPSYYGLRKGIAVPEPGKPSGCVDLNGFFGLHPRAAALAPLFAKGQAVALQAVGYDRNTRSHFEEQDTWETGVSGNTISSDGWLNRHLMTSQGHGPIRAVSVGDTLPRILRGKAPAFAMRGITDLGLFPDGAKGIDPSQQDRIAAALEHAYCCDPRVVKAAAAASSATIAQPGEDDVRSARELLSQTAQATFEGITQLKAVSKQQYTPAAKYPESDLGKRLAQVARLIKADIGLEVVEVDYGSWDTHQNQGSALNDGGGSYGRLVGGLADALAAFTQDIESRLDDVLVVTLSDFGRTAAENGTGGTDHGWANCMLAIGGPVLAASGAVAAQCDRQLARVVGRAVAREARFVAHDRLPGCLGRDRGQASGEPEFEDGASEPRVQVRRVDLKPTDAAQPPGTVGW